MTFPLSAPAQAAINSSATDLSFVIVANGPAQPGELLLDHLVVAEDDDPPAGGPAFEQQFVLSVPQGVGLDNVLLSGEERLTVDDRSTLGVEGQLVTAYSGGPATSEFGAGVQGHIDLFSRGDVEFLRSQSHIRGRIVTSGTVEQQDNVIVDGDIQENTPVASVPTEWSVVDLIRNTGQFDSVVYAANI